MIGRESAAVREFALYGETTGEIDEFGLPARAHWAAGYRGPTTVVYGDTPVVRADWVNNTLCIDTGCVFGGKLTALRWPERELVDVSASELRRTYPPARRWARSRRRPRPMQIRCSTSKTSAGADGSTPNPWVASSSLKRTPPPHWKS